MFNYKAPQGVDELRSFLGLASYYRHFIKDFAEIASLLYRLTSKNVPFVWTKEHETRFQELKFKLVTAPTLAFPDFTRSFKVDTDACEYGIGAVI